MAKLIVSFFLRAGFLAVLVAGAKAADVASESKPVIAPPTSWVTPHFFDRQSPTLEPDANADQHWLLLERQINVSSNETFYHCVRQFLTVAGVQNGSNLKIDYNPGYQSLVLHWARLWRGAGYTNRLDADKLRVMRQERDLEQDVLNGEQTAVLVMDDVRVGDIVDYAYSIKGANPVFNGRFSTGVSVQLAEPAERLLTRVFWPASRRLYTLPHGCSVQPVVTKKDSVECVWDLRQMPGFHQEDSLPVWCDPQPWVQISEFKTWTEVNQWALALFQNHAALSPELAQRIAEWKRLDSPELQVLSALRFVQDDVRYFGIEIGVGTEKPADPATVFARRYGDCKDKALLFVTLVRSLGLEACPVLVNTEVRRAIADWQPCADAFDHCIAVVQFGGQVYWLDPTAGYQRGPLAAHYLPDYGYGLVISPRTTALSPIPQATGLPQTTTTEYFTLGGKADAANLKVVTVADGRDADDLRATFAGTKRSDIEKNYTHFYAEQYPGVQMAAPLEIVDDGALNRFQITEYYTIDHAWVRSDKDGRYRCEFYPYCLTALTQKPVDTQRQLPLAVAFPQHRILRTDITLPEAWSLADENKIVEDPAFSFRKQASHTSTRLVVEYEFQSLADAVPAERTGEYLQRLETVSKSLGNTLVWK
jgi:transglutaminase-like putative cysteine protease